jgi:hypothetical protein
MIFLTVCNEKNKIMKFHMHDFIQAAVISYVL